MEKYLGNKRAILAEIREVADHFCGQYRSVCDIFTGTTNVARSFRRDGVDVIANDANRFSFVLGQTYLALRKYPRFEGLSSVRRPHPSSVDQLERQYRTAVARDGGVLFPSERAPIVWAKMSRAVDVLCHLNEVPRSTKSSPCHLLDHYTVFGKRSAFRSVRGTTGKRNYFSKENALHIDTALHTLRTWWQEGCITKSEVYFLLTALLEEVVIVANVNGTFHDFNRGKLWPNSLQTAILRLPLAYASNCKATVLCNDALQVSGSINEHDILYIDPPYNFRQYGAYYHFLNFIAAYPFLESVEDYLGGLEFVRGQNPADDFTSPFSFRDRFIASLRTLIAQSRSKYVLMSYFGGRNHWNHWTKGESRVDVGRDVLTPLFEDRSLFSDYRFVSLADARQNYQSRIGEKKEYVDEYLIIGKRTHKKSTPKTPQGAKKLSDVNAHWDLAAFA